MLNPDLSVAAGLYLVQLLFATFPTNSFLIFIFHKKTHFSVFSIKSSVILFILFFF